MKAIYQSQKGSNSTPTKILKKNYIVHDPNTGASCGQARFSSSTVQFSGSAQHTAKHTISDVSFQIHLPWESPEAAGSNQKDAEVLRLLGSSATYVIESNGF